MPIRVNLLAEAQAAEQERRQDPVKRAGLVGALLVMIVLGWASTLQFKIMASKNELSALEVKLGDMVKKGQTIGRSGATGLAGGDHLHFSMILHGVQVNPIEWWDPHWIDDRIVRKIREAGGKVD